MQHLPPFWHYTLIVFAVLILLASTLYAFPDRVLRWWRVVKLHHAFHKAKPVFSMSRYGQLTPRPRVALSLSSKNGSHGVFCEDDDDAGNARIEMYGRSLSNMTGIPMVDCRK